MRHLTKGKLLHHVICRALEARVSREMRRSASMFDLHAVKFECPMYRT